MAIGPEQGIMALPETQGMQAPQLSMMDSYDAMQQGLKTARPDASMELEEALAEIRPELDELSDEQLTQLIEAVQGLYGDPENYAKEVADLVKEELLDADDLPAEYDEEFLASFLMVLVDAQRSRMATAGSEQPMPEAPMGMAPMGMMPPQGFAKGGIAEAAQLVANSGRRGDTMLAHITPSEARLLKSRGGSGTINPETGLPEFFIKKIFKAVKKVVKSVGKVVKKVLKSPVGRILGTIALGMVLGPAVGAFLPGLSAGMAAGVTGALASSTVTALSGGDLKSILTSAATGFLGAPGGPVGNFIGKYTAAVGVTNAAANAAITGAVVGTGSGLISGQNLKDAVKSGLTEGAISGGMAFLSGAPKVEVENAAATAAKDAVDTQAYVDEFGGTTKPMQGAGAQRGGMDADMPISTSTRPINADTAITTQTFRDGRVTEQLVDMKGVPLTDVQTIAPGMAKAPSTAPIADTVAKQGIFGTPQAAQAQTLQGASRQMLPGIDTPTYPSGSLYQPPTSLPGIDTPYTGSTGVATAAAPYRPTGVIESLGEMGSGAKKFLTGDFSEGASQFAKGTGDLFAPGPSAEQVRDYMASTGMPNTPGAYNEALKQMGAPGMLRTYGPGVAAGIGALGLAGGFTPKPVPETEFQNQMRQPIDLSGDPSRYYVQNLPGVQYDERGNIIGSFTPPVRQTMDDIRVAGRSYIGYNPMSYQQQQYQPMFMNTGGIAALAKGGYPRRTGQISGPGTEKSDSIPAMLSDGEFVMTAKAVRGAGGGSRREGAKRMYALMNQLERNAARG